MVTYRVVGRPRRNNDETSAPRWAPNVATVKKSNFLHTPNRLTTRNAITHKQQAIETDLYLGKQSTRHAQRYNRTRDRTQSIKRQGL